MFTGKRHRFARLEEASTLQVQPCVDCGLMVHTEDDAKRQDCYPRFASAAQDRRFRAQMLMKHGAKIDFGDR